MSQLELLISLSIMGLIAVLLANVLNFSRMTNERAQEFSSEAGLFITRGSLRQWAEDAPITYSNKSVPGYFQGDKTDLQFHTLTTSDTFWGGTLTKVHLYEDGETLNVTLVGVETQSRDPLQVTRLLSTDLLSLRISYFGTKQRDPEARWHDNWEEATSLPGLIKVEWKNKSSASPPLILHPAKRDRQAVLSLGNVLPRH